MAAQTHGAAWSIRDCTIAFLPLLFLVGWQDGEAALGRLALGSVLATSWQALFARLRRRPLNADGWLTAGAMLVLLGSEVPLGQFCLALSFAIALGEQAFGGRGQYLVNPAIVGVAFYWFGFGPTDTPALAGVGWASLAAAGFLLLRRAIAWDLLAPMLLVWMATAAIRGALWWPLPDDPVWLIMLVLLADPSAGASSRLGRILHGSLAGALVAIAAPEPGALLPLSIAVFSAMLAGLFAPMFDRAALSLGAWRPAIKPHVQ